MMEHDRCSIFSVVTGLALVIHPRHETLAKIDGYAGQARV